MGELVQEQIPETRRLQRGRGLQPNGGSTPTTLGTACAKVGHRCSREGCAELGWQQSRNILEQYGNMSSATILFVLQASMADPTMQKDRLFSLAFGPGLTIETVGLTKLLNTSSMSDASSDASS